LSGARFSRKITLENTSVRLKNLGILALFCLSCALSPAWGETHRPLGLDLYRPAPDENPVTPDKVKLGRRLFRERLLSRDRTLACADCHQPKRSFTDGKAKAVGVYGRQGPRSVPTIVNRAWGEAFFWDGRIETLEQQVVQPILAETEMGMTLEEAVARLADMGRYRKEFQRVFGAAPNAENLAFALAAYVRTILSGDSPYDRYLFGDHEALSEDEVAGLRLFRGKANCSACHAGPTLTDEEFHNSGVAWKDGEYLDEGRFRVSQDPADRGKFKTPTLREVPRTAPYMHDGSLATLADVVDFYNDGARKNPNLDREFRPLKLSDEEKRHLVAFLGSLAGKVDEGKP
jgi:cytochrome c peroxidase